MKFQVGTSPSQLALGQQPTTTLVNDGSNTIWLDSNASVSPGTGFPLPPTGQMTWRNNQELWACTSRGISALRTHVHGNMSDANRASFNRVLFTYDSTVGSAGGDPENLIEVGFLSSIILKFTSFTIPAGFDTGTAYIFWYDDNEDVIDVKLVHFNLRTATTTQVSFPVSGRYMTIDYTGSDNYDLNLKILGSSQTTTGYRSLSPLIRTGAAPIGIASETANYIAFSGWTSSQALLIPSLGNRLTFAASILANANANALITVVSVIPNYNVVLIPVPVFAGSQFITADLIVPTSQGLKIQSTVTVNQSSTFNLTWEDY